MLIIMTWHMHTVDNISVSLLTAIKTAHRSQHERSTALRSCMA